MKTIKKTGITLLAAIALLMAVATNTVQAQPGVRVSFQTFYDELAPYGEWINDPEYGYIWLPYAEQGFQPYATNGHWVMTSYGNTWVSNYDWGWAPFHYGRWTYTDYYGWAWVPGYEWGPAWVSWRSGGGYYGWAPLGPSMGISININIPARHWVFVPQRYIASPRIYSYYTPYRNVTRIYNRTTIINNTYVYNDRTYVSGPRRSEIERATGSRVAVRNISRSSRPGRASVSSRSVSLYRPEVDRNSRTSARPSRVADAATVRTASRSTTGRTTTGRTSATRPTTTRPAATTRTAPATRSTATRPATRTAPATRTTTARPAATTRTAPATRSTTARPAATRTQRATPARSSGTSATTQRAARPSSSRSTSVRSQSSSRPKVSSSSRSQSSRSSATRSRSTERKSTPGRGRS